MVRVATGELQERSHTVHGETLRVNEETVLVTALNSVVDRLETDLKHDNCEMACRESALYGIPFVQKGTPSWMIIIGFPGVKKRI